MGNYEKAPIENWDRARRGLVVGIVAAVIGVPAVASIGLGIGAAVL